MAATEKEIAEFQEWATAETDEERQRIRSRWARQGPTTPVLSIPAERTNREAAGVLYRLLVDAGQQGIRPSDALAELRRQGHEYKHTGERVRRLVRAAEGESTGRGRGSRWRLA